MGTTTKRLESCWPCIVNVEEELKLTNTEASVAYHVVDKKECSPLKLDLKAAQTLASQSIETPDLPVQNRNIQNISSVVNSSCTNRSITLNPACPVASPMSTDVDEMCVEEETIFSGDSMDCVVTEEVVETSEYLDSAAPIIVLTEAVDLTNDEEELAELSSNLLTPGDLMEDCNSDHGYESYDSPISEPDQLVNLFPELW